MLKIRDKVRIIKRSDESNNWLEIGKGFVENVMTNKVGEVKFIKYRDKDWPGDITEIVSVNTPFFQVVKS